MKQRSLTKYIGILAFSLLAKQATAQQLPVMNHYLYNPYLYNPARTGQNDFGSMNLNFKRQWTALPDAPITGAFSVESPIKAKNLGVGGMLYVDKTHIINRVGGLATAAYHVNLGKNASSVNRLSGGISLGVINQRLDFANATVANPNDQAILGSAATGTAFDFSVGLDYQWKDLHVGASMLQGLNNPFKYYAGVSSEGVRYVNSRHMLLSASYNFKAGKDFEIQPVVLTRLIKGVPFQIEGNVLANWKRLLYLGFGYRSSNNTTATAALTPTFGVNLQNRIFFGYTFEFAVDGKLNTSLGTQHELMVSYRFGQNREMQALQESLAKQMEELKMRETRMEERLTNTENRLNNVTNTTDSLRLASESQKAEQEAMRKDIGRLDGALQDQQKQLDAQAKEIEELRNLLKNKPLEFKKIGEVYFDKGQSTLDAEDKSNLDAFAADFAKNPKIKIFLYGHASSDGDANTNFQLSNRRCGEVRKYLISKGIDGTRIRPLPSGEQNIVDPNSSSVSLKDRRVEVIISEDK